MGIVVAGYGGCGPGGGRDDRYHNGDRWVPIAGASGGGEGLSKEQYACQCAGRAYRAGRGVGGKILRILSYVAFPGSAGCGFMGEGRVAADGAEAGYFRIPAAALS